MRAAREMLVRRLRRLAPDRRGAEGPRPTSIRAAIAATLLTGHVVAAASGGLDAPILPWLLVLAPLVGLLRGPREGISTGAVVLAGVVALHLASGPEGFLPVVDTASRHRAAVVSYLALVVALVLAAGHFDRTTSRMRRTLDLTLDDAVQAHREVRLVLDHVHQGLVLVDASGRLTGVQSAFAQQVLGSLPAGEPVWRLFEPVDVELARWLELVWPTLRDPAGSFEIAIAPLPTRLVAKGRDYALTFVPIEADDRFAGVLLSLEDVTAEVEAEEAQRGQRELHRLATRVVRDPAGMRSFVEEGRRLLDQVRTEPARDARLRAVHTLKGNAALFGLERLSDLCHRLEARLVHDHPSRDQLEALATAWTEIEQKVRSMVGRSTAELEVSRVEVAQLVAAIDAGVPRQELRRRVESLADEPVSRRFARLAEQAQALAYRIGKGPVEVEMEDGAVRLSEGRHAPLWSALAHVVRNALDHGLESNRDRVRAGKPHRGHLRFEAAHLPDGWVRLSFSDDGAGIDWEALARRAAERGLPQTDRIDLVFQEGLSTRAEVTTISGRGVGMSVVRRTVEELGGRIEVRSARGEGTTFDIFLPPGSDGAANRGLVAAGSAESRGERG